VDAQERWYLDNIPLDGETVADVGANVGRLSQFFFDHGTKKTRVVSIEPLPANIKAIEARIRKSGASRRWTLKKCAISDRDGHLAMRQVKAAWGDNGVVVGPEEPADDKTVKVACRRLATLVPDATVVKIDVEGHEYAFLADALETMAGVGCWALELHCVAGHPLEETLRLLADRGLSLFTAGHHPDRPEHWVNVPISPALSWEQIPGTPSMRDGVPGMFKMLHVIAKRP
jgi:FkbM family methyltransferase